MGRARGDPVLPAPWPVGSCLLSPGGSGTWGYPSGKPPGSSLCSPSHSPGEINPRGASPWRPTVEGEAPVPVARAPRRWEAGRVVAHPPTPGGGIPFPAAFLLEESHGEACLLSTSPVTRSLLRRGGEWGCKRSGCRGKARERALWDWFGRLPDLEKAP